jgi:outer membrane receptor protein involved in Fe transport
VLFNSFGSEYNTNPGTPRDLSKVYKFGNNYYVDEHPFGYYQGSVDVVNPSGMILGSIYSQARDSSKVRNYNLKFDLSSQLDKYNEVKVGFFVKYTDNNTNYGLRSLLYSTNNQDFKWDTKPIQGAVYLQDKLEFEAMVATVGVRVEFSDPNTEWFNYQDFSSGFSSANSSIRDELIAKRDLPTKVTWMPRLGMSFPITVNSKIFFNYGHYQSLPIPVELYLIDYSVGGKLEYIANPLADLEKTIAYEIGYEHNLFDQFLLRVTGYYKDIKNEAVDVDYIGSDGDVSYSRSEPVQYRDIRGFEFELNKNRGEWITGFINYNYRVSSTGRFGWGEYNENKTEQVNYIETDGEAWYQQSKPKPLPVARLNLDIFTPDDFGPELDGIYPLEGLRFNVLSSWQAGSYTTWTGGGNASRESTNNLQWVDYFNTNLRISKVFYFGPVDVQLFVQINNLFDTKRLSSTGFSRSNFDYINYVESLHLPNDTPGAENFNSYVNIPGDDQLGNYREPGVAYVPIQAEHDINILSTPLENLIYFDEATSNYYEYISGEWKTVDSNMMNKILEDKAYIDMPNFGFFTFLNPRETFFGLKFNITL